ncbi:MAG: hypothetical protein FWG71_08160 [Synergistaceae bacterium]|nr:hypothetical protein [Synergistaceae bacterium]
MSKSLKFVLAALIVFLVAAALFVFREGTVSSSPFSSSADASPQDALSARPAESFYVTGRLGDLGGTLGGIFSQANVNMATSLMSPRDAEQLRAAAAVVSQIPAKSAAFVLGFERANIAAPFLQLAVSMPDDVSAELSRVEKGEAGPGDIATLIAGRAGMPFASVALAGSIESRQGARGSYYALSQGGSDIVLTARGGTLLLSLSPGDLEASVGALETPGSRLDVRRRFNTPDYLFFHIDMPTIAAASNMLGDTGIDHSALLPSFKAPLRIETAFSSRPGTGSRPGTITLSMHANVREALASIEEIFTKPAIGANLFLAGSGKLFSAFAIPISFKASDLRIYPEIYREWGNFTRELAGMGITEKDVEDLLTGTFSLVLGGDSSVMGRRSPGGYIALSGRNGAASKILNALAEEAQFRMMLPLTPPKPAGWDHLFAAVPGMLPVPLLLGTSGETLFLGILNPDGLDKKPELPSEAERLFKDSIVGGGFVDTAAIWNWIKAELSDNQSPMSPSAQMRPMVETFLNTELSVPFIKMWQPDAETFFTEVTTADVPLERSLFPKIAAMVLDSTASGTASHPAPEAANIISDLRTMKAAGLMFYADSMDAVEAGTAPRMSFFSRYADYNPERFATNDTASGAPTPPWLEVVVGTDGDDAEAWFVGRDISQVGSGVRRRLTGRAQSVGLLAGPSNAEQYNDGTQVWMRVR